MGRQYDYVSHTPDKRSNRVISILKFILHDKYAYVIIQTSYYYFTTMTPLEIVRRNNKLSQEELGKKLGVSQTTIQRLETNTVWPSKKIVTGILTLFKNQITTDEILFPERFTKR